MNKLHKKKLSLFIGVVLGVASLPGWGVGSRDPVVQELLRKLEARDRLIADLQRRVTHLEQVVEAKQPQPTSPRESTKSPAPSRQVAKAQVPAKPAKPKQSAIGAFEVDEEAAERALERTLTQTGALLLPLRRAEIQPFFNYIRQEIEVPQLVQVGQDLVTVKQKIRRNQFEPGVFARFGLPMESQLELRLPYTIVDRSEVSNLAVVGGQISESNNSASHIGDLQVGIAKTVFREKGWRPDLIARLTWVAPTGRKFQDGISLGGGFHRLRGSLTMLKRQDPLAFTGRFFYDAAFDDHNDNPGDRFGFSIGTFLAASPETSLSISLQQSFVDDIKLNGRTINGTDRVISSVVLGASTILGRGFLLSVFGGIGLTDDSPDYFINVSMPLRFDLPFTR